MPRESSGGSDAALRVGPWGGSDSRSASWLALPRFVADGANGVPHHSWRPYFGSLALMGLITVFGLEIEPRLAPANAAMLYLLAIVMVALRWGRGPALASAIAGTVVFAFLLIPAVRQFGVNDVWYLITVVSLLLVGLLISTLASGAREQAEAARRNQAATRQAELLRRSDEMQQALLNSISHNLRTPLATVTGALQTLLRDGAILDEATRHELLTNAEEQAARLNRLVANLLDMTRLEAGALKVKLELCDVGDVIGAAEEQLGEAARSRHITVDMPSEQILVALDFVLISQVIVNLLDNALKYSPADEPVEIRVRQNAVELEIAVLDHGIGISEQDQASLFKRFQRGSRSSQAAGTGLGLSICRRFVEAHGGRIRAERREPRGAVFAFTIPLRAQRSGIRNRQV